MNDNTYLIGVDIGTNGTKTAIYDISGNLVSDTFEESKLYYPEPGAVEQDLEEIYISVINTIKECVEKSDINTKNIAAIAIDGQMAGICGIDDKWSPITPYDSWLDTRCAPYITKLKSQEERIISIVGGPPSFTHGAKMLWWKYEKPEVFKRIRKFIMPSVYVAGKLSNLKAEDAYIDYTYIHFSCLADNINARWSEDLCKEFGLPIEKLPKIIKPWQIIGKLSNEAAKLTKLNSGIPIAAGCGDTAATMLGAGFNKPGMIFDVAGTASVFAICIDRFVPDVENKTLFTGRLVPEGLWYSLAYINGGGLNLRWFRDKIISNELNRNKIIGEDLYSALEKLALKVEPGSERLVFIPHLGGRICPSRPSLRGCWIGLNWRHSIGHLYRSILEAVAYEYAIYRDIEKRLVPELKFEVARVIGGGSRSKLWNQIKSDVIGIPYERLEREEFGTMGSAILAGYSVGLFDNIKEISDKFNNVLYSIHPDPEISKIYQEYINYYKFLLELTENKIFKYPLRG